VAASVAAPLDIDRVERLLDEETTERGWVEEVRIAIVLLARRPCGVPIPVRVRANADLQARREYWHPTRT
jgi:hypothetical protein